MAIELIQPFCRICPHRSATWSSWCTSKAGSQYTVSVTVMPSYTFRTVSAPANYAHQHLWPGGEENKVIFKKLLILLSNNLIVTSPMHKFKVSDLTHSFCHFGWWETTFEADNVLAIWSVLLGHLESQHLSNKNKAIAKMEMAHFHTWLKDQVSISRDLQKWIQMAGPSRNLFIFP